MWLAVCAPAVSQFLAAHRAAGDEAIYAAYCAVADNGHAHDVMVATMQDHGDAMDHGAGHGEHDSMPAGHDMHGDVCGYCSLLAAHPPLTMPPLAAAVSFSWVARAGPAVVIPFVTARLTLSPPARAPPSLS